MISTTRPTGQARPFHERSARIPVIDRIRPLEMLVRTVEAGSFAGAAAALRLTPSAVSHGIAELERRLGAALLYRTTRRVQLTEEGEAAYRCGHDVIERLAALDGLAAPAGPLGLSGTLRVGIDPVFRRHILSSRLAVFMRSHPALRFEFLAQTEPREMHLTGTDILLRFGDPPDSSLIARRLGHAVRVTWASPDYLNEFGTPAQPEDLHRHRCLVYKAPQLTLPLRDWIFARGTERRVIGVPATLVTDDRDAMIALAAAGAGIIRAGVIRSTLLAARELIRVLPDWDCPPVLPLYALYRRTDPLPARVVAFLDHLTEAAAAFDPDGMSFVAAPARNRVRKGGRIAGA